MSDAPPTPAEPAAVRAARGLGLVYASLALAALGLFAVGLVHTVLPAAWEFTRAAIDTVGQVLLALALLGDLVGRSMCHKAPASFAAKKWLRASVAVGAVAFVGALIPPAWQGLAWWGVVPAEGVPPSWPTLAGVFAVVLLSHGVFLRYLRGLAEGLDLRSFVVDCDSLPRTAVVTILVVPAVVAPAACLVWYLYNALSSMAEGGDLPAERVLTIGLGFVLLGYLWPVSRYLVLLTMMREQVLYDRQRAAEEKHGDPHANPHHNW